MKTTVALATALVVAGWCAAAQAQLVPAPPQMSTPAGAPAADLQTALGANPLQGSVPSGPATPGLLRLSLSDAITRALKYNLGVINGEQDIQEARGARRQSLAGLLPNLSTAITDTEQQTNLEAYGFPPLPGIPQIIGPFNAFDARVFLQQPILDFPAINRAREQARKLSAARDDYRNARDLVVLVAANLYLQTVAAQSRIDAALAERKTAQALDTLAVDLKTAGIAAGIDVLRAHLQLQVQEQRLIVARNDFDKLKLQLGRAIGLPAAQAFTLTDKVPYAPLQPVSLDAALTRAYASRGDYLAAEQRVAAAEAQRRAALSERLPSVSVNANIGDIGLTVSGARETFAVAGSVSVPLFTGGRIAGALMQADANLARQRAQLANLRQQIGYDVRTALLDLTAAQAQLTVARTAVALAGQELQQARDRFSAGVADNVEVIQAQEAVATANENYISSLYAHNMAKASLARALGIGEEAVESYLGGSR